MSEYNDFTIIGTTGFGESGSSALTNILEEFECVSTVIGGATFECKFFSNNLFQLETALRNELFVNAAVKEMLYQAKLASNDQFYITNFGKDFFFNSTMEYIKTVTGSWLGGMYSERDADLIPKEEIKNFKRARFLFDNLYKNKYELYEQYYWRPSFQTLTEQYYGKFDNEFYKKTQAYTSKIFTPIAQNKRFILVDALFRPESVIHELNWFLNAKCLIGDRDPRDLYVINKMYKGEPYLPTWTVETYIDWFKTYRSCNRRNAEHFDTILQLKFEDLIYNYEGSLAKIKKFLDLKDSEHIKKGQIFIPEKSKTNTQLFRKYPKYAKDIEKIEKELPEFCYPYSETQIRHFLPEEIKGENRETLEDIRKTVCIFQKTGKLPFSNIKGAFLFSKLGELIQNFKDRKTIFSKIKGIIKLILFFPYYLADFYKQLKFLNEYQTKNKDKVVEFK
ncbi:sulfotransferase family protein [Treponema denticola]|uniref:sulfotransferase family protein n=1 Tax=Treponema denticola TaxID=158 RepID=UPI003D6E61FF